MARLEILNGKLYSDELHAPGYVWFRCADYGLPDNTMGKVGYHVVYCPLGKGFTGHEHVTDAMREDVRALYAAEKAASEKTEVEAVEAEKEAEAAEIEELKVVEVPAPAVAAFRKYAGSAERAWANEDERAWHLIRRYGEAIQVQGLAR